MDNSIYFDGRHYDALMPGVRRKQEIAFYLRHIRTYGEPVLELGCGTGQLTLPLAQAGVNITGLDLAASMLTRARTKAEEQRLEITWTQADCRDFDLAQQFGLVFFPINSLLHLLTRQDLEACLKQVKRHLKPEGAFVFEIFNPSLAVLTRDSDQRYPVSTYADPDGRGIITVTENNVYDAATQINHIRWYYRLEGRTEENAAELNLRMLFPQEIEALLYYNGFQMTARDGDYDGAPFTSDSMRQLIVCKPT